MRFLLDDMPSESEGERETTDYRYTRLAAMATFLRTFRDDGISGRAMWGLYAQSNELTRGLPELFQHFRLQGEYTSAQERCKSQI